MNRFLKPTLYLALGALSFQLLDAAHPSSGLWVGEVALNEVNEATGAVGDSNTYEFTDPSLTTATSDTAYLRLIFHVNAAGQVQLLKSVAIATTGTLSDGSTDLVLLTNPELYPNYPGLAKRVASAFYDFGDEQAVAAVQTVIDTAVQRSVELGKDGAAADTFIATIQGELDDLAAAAQVATTYLDRGTGADSFITSDFFQVQGDVETIGQMVAELMHAGTNTAADFALAANATTYEPFSSPPAGFDTVVGEAFALQADSFYGDTRPVDAVVRIVYGSALAVEALGGSATEAEKIAVAKIVAVDEWHNAGDVTQGYNRFLASASYEGLPEVVVEAAVDEAILYSGRGLTEGEIRTAVHNAITSEAIVINAYFEAETVASESLHTDSRAGNVIDRILLAAENTAAAQVLIDPTAGPLTDAVEIAVAEVVDSVRAGYVFATAPSEQYTDFIESSTFSDAVTTAVEAAANEVERQRSNGVIDEDGLLYFADFATDKALVAIRNEAAALPKYSVPLDGGLEPGAAISGEFYLPALAPTNPFLHRLHPDHTTGIAITRRIALSVDSEQESELSSYGVSVLAGTYEEEIFGLHKPLGPQQDIGLKTKGRFTLNRLTLTDSLNF